LRRGVEGNRGSERKKTQTNNECVAIVVVSPAIIMLMHGITRLARGVAAAAPPQRQPAPLRQLHGGVTPFRAAP
jgi:hypothetical protein